MLVTWYKIGQGYVRLLGTNGFHVKAEIERFNAEGWRCRQNLKYENFTSSFGTTSHITKKRAARAARLFFFIQPIKSLILALSLTILNIIDKGELD